MRFLEPFGREGVIYSNIFFQILCKSTAILLHRCEENIKKLLNRIFVASHSLSIDSESHSATFLKKSTFIKIYLSRCFPVAPVLITKDEPKKNQRTTKELQNSKKYIY